MTQQIGGQPNGPESPSELEQRIRFALSTLGERSAHHEFEQLCLGLARRRIVRNLMPATGPVSSKGDQGRDGESYWTVLDGDPNTTVGYSAEVSGDLVVMACTIQADDVQRKVRSDVAKLASQGVDRVLYFFTGPLPIGRRNEVKAEVRETHGIELEFWDRNAIATELADFDLYYLAVRYLDLPSSLAPDPPAIDSNPDWYAEALEHWRSVAEPASSLGDLVELRQPLRQACSNPDALRDLAEWLGYLRPLLDSESPSVRARARYEYIVATLRGFGSLRDVDALTRLYFDDLTELRDDFGVLDDATILVEFAVVAWFSGATSITRSEIESWRGDLRGEISRQLGDSPFPNAEVVLLTLSARVDLQPTLPPVEQVSARPSVDLVADLQAIRRSVESGGGHLRAETGAGRSDFVDLDAAMEACVLLLERAANAPAAPLQDAVDRFDLLAALVHSHPLYRQVRDGFDDWAASIEGDAVRGERAQQRALDLLDADLPLDALQEVHEAKIRWWHGDTMEGAVIMCMLASRIYRSLGLYLAAKNYALAGAGMARQSNRDELMAQVPRGLMVAAVAEFYSGAWLTSTRSTLVAVLAQHAYCDDPMNEERYGYITDALVSLAQVAYHCSALDESYSQLLEGWLDEVPGSREVVDHFLAVVDSVPVRAPEQVALGAASEGLGQPFADAGPRRSYRWSALGTTWEVRCDNEREAVLAAERLGAALQITLAELAQRDPLLLTGSVYIDVVTGSADGSVADRCRREPENHGSRWRIELVPESELDSESAHLEIMMAVMQIVADRSLLAKDAFTELLDHAFRDGIWHKLLPGRPYDDWAGYIESDRYAAMSTLPPERGFYVSRPTPVGSPHLEPIRTPAPSYDQAENLELIADRYETSIPALRYSVAAARGDAQFQATIAKLRSEGWLDWHVLVAMLNVAGQDRFRRSGIELTVNSTSEERRAVVDLMARPELETDDLTPAAEFAEQALRSGFDLALLAGLQRFGLVHHAATPDLDGIREFFGRRLALWIDDVAHEDVLGPSLEAR